MALTQQKKMGLALALLLSVFALVIYFQFFAGGGTAPAGPSQANVTRPARTRGAAQPATTSVRAKGELPVIDAPLDLAAMSEKAGAGAGTGRNIFVYPPPPTPTPTPTPKPTPTPVPPPITVAGLNPSSVIARTADFTLTVLGAKIPADAKAFINGREFPTTFVNETQLKVAVTAATIAAAGALRVEVRSAADPQLYSNPVNLGVSDPPAPPYRYIGMIVSRQGAHTAILKADDDPELITVNRGQSLGRNWRVVNITDQIVEILDTNINVTHRIRYTGEQG
jgi:hypothetical protein